MAVQTKISYIPYGWKNDASTPTDAAGLKAMESRLAAYAELVGSKPRCLSKTQIVSDINVPNASSNTSLAANGLTVSATTGSLPVYVLLEADGMAAQAAFGCGLYLNEDGTRKGTIGFVFTQSGVIFVPEDARRYRDALVPGLHTWYIEVQNALGDTHSFTMKAGDGNGNNNRPATLSVWEY